VLGKTVPSTGSSIREGPIADGGQPCTTDIKRQTDSDSTVPSYLSASWAMDTVSSPTCVECVVTAGSDASPAQLVMTHAFGRRTHTNIASVLNDVTLRLAFYRSHGPDVALGDFGRSETLRWWV